MEKICLFCKHFVLETGEPDLSDVTPGYEGQIRCNKYHWVLDMFSDTTETYRKYQLQAQTCSDFELTDLIGVLNQQ